MSLIDDGLKAKGFGAQQLVYDGLVEYGYQVEEVGGHYNPQDFFIPDLGIRIDAKSFNEERHTIAVPAIQVRDPRRDTGYYVLAYVPGSYLWSWTIPQIRDNGRFFDGVGARGSGDPFYVVGTIAGQRWPHRSAWN